MPINRTVIKIVAYFGFTGKSYTVLSYVSFAKAD
jgi:hypothetical protein